MQPGYRDPDSKPLSCTDFYYRDRRLYGYNDAGHIAVTPLVELIMSRVTDVNGMKSIYDQVYEMEKQLYMVEFEDKSDMKLESKSRYRRQDTSVWNMAAPADTAIHRMFC